MAEQIRDRVIDAEMSKSYITYAMSVIVGRALPDVRDGLKPVHRRILYGMRELDNTPDKPYKKSARIVGDVMGKYHPHGDSAIYDTLVRMAQDFSLRYPLVDGQGNFGSIDGDSPAAMRYTEARMAKVATTVLADLEKDTVDWVDNFDGSLKEPEVLPSMLPDLLVNGSSGIAVGMATNIPPHNLGEVVDATVAVIDDPDIDVQGLMEHLPAPDFPTGAYILGRAGAKAAYATGRGSITMRATTNIEEAKNHQRIIVSEIPYQVNKSTLLEAIADLVRDKRIEGIADLRDESDKEGIRIVVELKGAANADVVLNQLFKHTQLQSTFGVNNVALVEGEPKVLTLRQTIDAFLKHRVNVVVRRSKFELAKAEARAHILEGLKIAVANLDAVVALIRKAKDPAEAEEQLRKRYSLSEEQAKAILNMRLSSLTRLSQDKLDEEYASLKKIIAHLKDLLASSEKIQGVIRDELLELKRDFGDDRRTEILEAADDIEDEDLIPEERVVVTLTRDGYVKKIPEDQYRAQGRGGRGVIGIQPKEEDFVEDIFVASTHDHILVFTNLGRVYWLKGYQIPTTSRYAKGKAIVNLLAMSADEKVMDMIPVSDFDKKGYLVIATKNGLVKKTALAAYSRPRRGGIIACQLREADEVIDAKLAAEDDDIVIATARGKAIRFDGGQVRPTGRNTMGVRGIKLRKGDHAACMAAVGAESVLLSVTENGYGKRTPIAEYPRQNRGGQGVIDIKTTERNGPVIAIRDVAETVNVLLTTNDGIVIKMPVESISQIGRNTMGVRLMRIGGGQKVAAVARVGYEEEAEEA